MATYAGHTYANGSVPTAILAPLDGPHLTSETPKLRLDAAASWNRAWAEVLAKTGIRLVLRGWNRTYQEQVRFFLERYRPQATGVGPYGDVRSWKGVRYVRYGTAAAAIPGQSNHGWGLAVDIADFGAVGQWNHPNYLAAWPILAKHGWTEDEGRGSIQEPWHKVYDPARDTHPAPPTPERETFMPDLTAKQQAELAARVHETNVGVNRLEKILAQSTKNEPVTSKISRIDSNTRSNKAALTALTSAVETLAKSVGIDPKVVTANIDRAVAASLGRMENDFHETLSDLSITLTTTED